MATTKYEVFTRYFNEVASVIVENPSDVKWISSEDWRAIAEFSTEWDAILASPTAIDIHTCFEILPNTKLKTSLPNTWTQPTTVTISETQYPDSYVYNRQKKIMQKIVGSMEATYSSLTDGPWETVKTGTSSNAVAIYKFVSSPMELGYMTKNETDFDLITLESTEGRDLDVYGTVTYYTVADGYYDIVDEVRERYVAKANYLKKYEKGLASKEEIAVLRPSSNTFDESLDMEYYQNVIDESNANNPKYNFIYIYDGLVKYYPKNPGSATYKNFWIYDRMKRIELDPWFLYSVHASLASALEKAEQLVQKIGLKAIRIGKIVELDQYIDIY